MVGNLGTMTRQLERVSTLMNNLLCKIKIMMFIFQNTGFSKRNGQDFDYYITFTGYLIIYVGHLQFVLRSLTSKKWLYKINIWKKYILFEVIPGLSLRKFLFDEHLWSIIIRGQIFQNSKRTLNIVWKLTITSNHYIYFFQVHIWRIIWNFPN